MLVKGLSFDLEEILAPLYPSLRFNQGKHIISSTKDVESLRRSSTLSLQDTEDFETEEEIFQIWKQQDSIAIMDEENSKKVKYINFLFWHYQDKGHSEADVGKVVACPKAENSELYNILKGQPKICVLNVGLS